MLGCPYQYFARNRTICLLDTVVEEVGVGAGGEVFLPETKGEPTEPEWWWGSWRPANLECNVLSCPVGHFVSGYDDRLKLSYHFKTLTLTTSVLSLCTTQLPT